MNPSNVLKQLAGLKGAGDGVRVDMAIDKRSAYLASSGAYLTTTLTTNPGFIVGSGIHSLRWNATIVVAAGLDITIPGDYDSTADELKLILLTDMGGATDTPELSVDGVLSREGVAAAALAAVTGENPETGVALTLGGTTAKEVAFDLSGQGFLPGDTLHLTLTPAAHGNDVIDVLGIICRYKSQIVLMTESER